MRIQLTPGDILFAVTMLILTAWRAQLVLAVIAFLFLIFHHLIIGGLIGLVAAVAFETRRRHGL